MKHRVFKKLLKRGQFKNLRNHTLATYKLEFEY